MRDAISYQEFRRRRSTLSHPNAAAWAVPSGRGIFAPGGSAIAPFTTKATLLTALAVLLGGGVAAACTIDPWPQSRHPNETYFIATPLDRSMDVAAPEWCTGCPKTVGAQLAQLGKVGGARATEVDAAARAVGGRIALVPWSTRDDCAPELMNKPLPYWSSAAPGVFTALLRARSGWRDGVPTFDVHAAYLEPYPYGEYLRAYSGERDAGFELTVEQYYSLHEALPDRDAYQRDPVAAAQSVLKWKAAHPELALRAPAAAILARFPEPPARGPGPLPPEKLRRE